MIPYQSAIAEVFARIQDGEKEGQREREREREIREVESFERALTRRDGTSRWVVDSPFLLSSNPGPGPRPRTRFPSALRPSSSLPFTFSYTTRLCVHSFSLFFSFPVFLVFFVFVFFATPCSSLRFSSVHADASSSTPFLPDSKQHHAVPTPLIHISHERIPNYLDAGVFRSAGAGRPCNEGSPSGGLLRVAYEPVRFSSFISFLPSFFFSLPSQL